MGLFRAGILGLVLESVVAVREEHLRVGMDGGEIASVGFVDTG